MAEFVLPQALGDPVREMVTEEGLLSPNGRRKLGLDAEKLTDLFRKMVQIRRIDQEALNLQRQGELGLWGQFLGQEAVHVGAAEALRPSDWIFPSYREFGMAMCRGIDPVEMLAIFRGLVHGAWNPTTYRFAPFVIPVGTQVPHAVGFAMGCRFDGSRDVVLVTFGDGATSTGDWHEAMNFAGVFRAPIVFLCQNNQWAISVPLRKQTAGSIAERAVGYGFPGTRIDGNDILTVFASVRSAVERARGGEGPYLIEAVTYRLGAHTSADDPTRYRSDTELEEWKARDPIKRYEAWLKNEGIMDESQSEVIRAEAASLAEKVRIALRSAPVPDAATTLFDHVYERPPRGFEAERDEFASSLESP